jgi:HSP20 family protein
MSKEKEKEPTQQEQGASTEARATDRPDGGQATLARRGPSTPALWSGDPFGIVRHFAEEMERVFDDFGFGRGLRSRFTPRGVGLDLTAWSPQVEVLQRGDRLVVRADLPGLTKDDVQVEVTDDAVTIRGERRQEHEERREGYFHSERSYGSFYRRIPLPEGVEADKADANFRDGVLEVTMPAPKREASRGRRIEVKG